MSSPSHRTVNESVSRIHSPVSELSSDSNKIREAVEAWDASWKAELSKGMGNADVLIFADTSGGRSTALNKEVDFCIQFESKGS